MAYNEINEEFMAIWQMKWECNSWWLVDMEVEEENRERHTKKDMQDFYLSISLWRHHAANVYVDAVRACAQSPVCAVTHLKEFVFLNAYQQLFFLTRKKIKFIWHATKKVKTLLFQWKIEYSRQWQAHAAFLGPLKLTSYIYHSTNDF